MWASIRCKTVSHAGNLPSEIMDSVVHLLNLSSSHLYFHDSAIEGIRPGRNNCRSSRKYCSLANSRHIFLYSVLYLSNVPTSTEQEHDYLLLSSIFNHNSSHPFLALDSEIQVWDQRSTGVNNSGILDTERWSTSVYYMWRVPRNMEGFLGLSFQGSLASYKALLVIWCQALVSFGALLCVNVRFIIIIIDNLLFRVLVVD